MVASYKKLFLLTKKSAIGKINCTFVVKTYSL